MAIAVAAAGTMLTGSGFVSTSSPAGESRAIVGSNVTDLHVEEVGFVGGQPPCMETDDLDSGCRGDDTAGTDGGSSGTCAGECEFPDDEIIVPRGSGGGTGPADVSPNPDLPNRGGGGGGGEPGGGGTQCPDPVHDPGCIPPAPPSPPRQPTLEEYEACKMIRFWGGRVGCKAAGAGVCAVVGGMVGGPPGAALGAAGCGIVADAYCDDLVDSNPCTKPTDPPLQSRGSDR